MSNFLIKYLQRQEEAIGKKGVPIDEDKRIRVSTFKKMLRVVMHDAQVASD